MVVVVDSVTEKNVRECHSDETNHQESYALQADLLDKVST